MLFILYILINNTHIYTLQDTVAATTSQKALKLKSNIQEWSHPHLKCMHPGFSILYRIPYLNKMESHNAFGILISMCLFYIVLYVYGDVFALGLQE